MIGSILTRGLVMVLGYAYPAFECYKTVEKNRPQIEELRFWCQYWILVAILTVTERIGDVFISWVPMYSEAKLAFYIYLWYPKTRGTTYIYDSFFKPYMEKHEIEIDRSLLELRTRAGGIAIVYWQTSASFVKTRIFDILQFVAAQSTIRPRPAEPDQGPAKVSRTTSGNSRLTENAQPETEEPPSPSPSTGSSQQSIEVEETVVVAPKTAPSAPNSPKPNPTLRRKSAVTVSPPPTETGAKVAVTGSTSTMVTVPTTVASPKGSNLPPKDTVMEDTLRITRAKLRKNRSTAGAGTSANEKNASVNI
uniref:HVA22-like protein n=1 Tax=Kalanchoe fedtschenkoi TaxID=63787 RepID=A0A7N0V417_KALFE